MGPVEYVADNEMEYWSSLGVRCHADDGRCSRARVACAAHGAARGHRASDPAGRARGGPAHAYGGHDGAAVLGARLLHGLRRHDPGHRGSGPGGDGDGRVGLPVLAAPDTVPWRRPRPDPEPPTVRHAPGRARAG